MQNPLSLSLFHLMFDEARRSQPPSRDRLGLLLGVSLESIDAALVSLERRGLVDARRARLTMSGLAIAAATRSSGALRSLRLSTRRDALAA
jgi:Mn-dependent DtxR family transcriptional regulator